MKNGSDWIQTYTGKKFFPLDPDPDQICIEDIAHALSNVCRYAGHSNRFYSVAQHSIMLAEEFFSGWQYKFVALLHDASEAYLGDIPRPLKHHPDFAFYRDAEAVLQQMIFDKFYGPIRSDDYWDQKWWTDTTAKIKQYDSAMIAHEARVFLEPLHPEFRLPEPYIAQLKFEPWYPQTAKDRFLQLYHRLVRHRDEKLKEAA